MLIYNTYVFHVLRNVNYSSKYLVVLQFRLQC